MLIQLCDIMDWSGLVSLMWHSFGIIMKQKPPITTRPQEITSLVNNLFAAKGDKAMWILYQEVKGLLSVCGEQDWTSRWMRRHSHMVETLFPNKNGEVWDPPPKGRKWCDLTDVKEFVMEHKPVPHYIGKSDRHLLIDNRKWWYFPEPSLEPLSKPPYYSSITRLLNGEDIWPIIVGIDEGDQHIVWCEVVVRYSHLKTAHMFVFLRPIISLTVHNLIRVPFFSKCRNENMLLEIKFPVCIDSSWVLWNNENDILESPLTLFHHPLSILNPLLDKYLPTLSTDSSQIYSPPLQVHPSQINTPPLQFEISTHLLLHYRHLRKRVLDTLITTMPPHLPIACIHIIWLYVLETMLSEFIPRNCC